MSELPHDPIDVKWEVVDHWLKNWEDPENAKVKGDSCAYCRVYFRYYDTHDVRRPSWPENTDCTGCPVHSVTGLDGCINTPWEEVVDSLRDLRHKRATNVLVKKAMEKEYRFLVHIALGEIEEAKALCDI